MFFLFFFTMKQGPGSEVGWKSTTLPNISCLTPTKTISFTESRKLSWKSLSKYSPPDPSRLLLSEMRKHICCMALFWPSTRNLLSVKLSLQLKCWHLMSCKWGNKPLYFALCLDFIIVSVSLMWRDQVMNEGHYYDECAPLWITLWQQIILQVCFFKVSFILFIFQSVWEDVADLCSNNAWLENHGGKLNKPALHCFSVRTYKGIPDYWVPCE